MRHAITLDVTKGVFMVYAITPVTPLINISPIGIYKNRDILIPLNSYNLKVQRALEENLGNTNSNPNIFDSELNTNRDVIVPINAKTPEIDAKLTENDGNTLDNGISASAVDNTINNTSFNNISNSQFSEVIPSDVSIDQLYLPFNDSITTSTDLNSITSEDTILPIDSVIVLQEQQTAVPINFQLGYYNYLINALQGGLNIYSPINELSHQIDFEY
jgi:hypothetical protein